MSAGAPKIENAPGLTWNARKSGWEARWQADTVLVRRGYLPKSSRIWAGPEADLTDAAINFIQDRCRILQAEMRTWSRGGTPVDSKFDGTMRSLIACYQTDKFSPYQKIRHQTREFYDNICARLLREHGFERVENIDSRMLMEWHQGWSANGKIALSHSMVAMLRTLFTFGATLLKDKDCRVIKADLHDLRFTMPKPRNVVLTAEQAVAIRTKAHELGLHSVAIAQAFQYDCTFRQKDCIGEWVPLSEPVPSDLIDGNEKWIRGLRWQEIDQNMVLRHTTSKRLKDVEIDLRLAPMVMEELTLIYGVGFTRAALPGSGPVVISDGFTRLPYKHGMFRRRWRQIANAAGIPKSVRNMDSRAGAITEALQSGARLDAVRKSATHSNSSMTQRYSRSDAEDTAEVMQSRAEFRKNKAGTKAREQS